ncbi:hypothetical protein [Spirosoma litoris]
MITKKNIHRLYADLETFVKDCTNTIRLSTDEVELDILKPLLEQAQKLKEDIEPIL